MKRQLLIGAGASLLWVGYAFFVLQGRGLVFALSVVGLVGMWGALLFSYFMAWRSRG